MTLHELVQKIYPEISGRPSGEVYLNCPFCDEEVGKKDYKHRFGLNTRSGVGHCHRCEKKHSAKGGRRYWFKELCRVFRLPYKISLEELEDNDEPRTSTNQEESKQITKVTLPREYEPLWKNVNDAIGRRALNYLRARNIRPSQIADHKIGFCAVGKFAHRIIIPVYSPKGKLKAFVGRDFSGTAELRYKNSEGAKALFNVPAKRNKEAMLGEGIFDVLAFERTSHAKTVDAIAGLGKSLTKKQLRQLALYSAITIWPDADRAGVEGTIKRSIALAKRNVAVYIVLPDEDIETDTDLGAMPSYEIERRFKERVPYSKAVASKMRLRVASLAPKKRKVYYGYPKTKS